MFFSCSSLPLTGERILTLTRVLLFLRYYDRDSPLRPEAPLYHGTILGVGSVFAIFVLPICILALWNNVEWFTIPTSGWGFMWYLMTVGIFRALVIFITFFVFGIGQFVCQSRFMKSRGGSFSLWSTAQLSVTLFCLAILLLLRTRPNVYFQWGPDMNQAGMLLYLLLQLSVVVGYLMSAFGYMILVILCIYYRCKDGQEEGHGQIHLPV